MNILIKLSCLVGLTLAPILGYQVNKGAAGHRGDGKAKVECHDKMDHVCGHAKAKSDTASSGQLRKSL